MNLSRLKPLLLVSVIAFAASCGISKKQRTSSVQATPGTSPVEVKAPERPHYQETKKRVHDLLHTRLEVRFDWTKAYLYGKATLTLKPYFYPSNTVTLDAKGMEIKEVSLVTGKEKKKLEFGYDKSFLTITLDKEYTREETYTIFIDYVAKPNELEARGSAAISDAKGLYFINPDGKELNKPRQIWTQGETEASSCWFPTIDAPNERMTQEICMTVEQNFVTLSNGLLEYSTINPDGTRTDCWKQSLPHAPYLAMMAVGEYAIVKDKWRNLEVNYYVEPAYEKYAHMIFGNTPEMMEFFSKKLGVDYPWEKYSQIVVRDYVSGAMENTTATIHGEFLQVDDREYLDGTNEDVISHELFHQWFGDLVTCESWSNLPLNESFATYGEYLWNEYKYGRDAADYGGLQDLSAYLSQAASKDPDLIRFDYKDKEDMFDAISYQKGGRILHMLRKYVGDEAFFLALKNYLNAHKFSAAEVHDLRLEFEKVTGEDLNWFFNQWFLDKGYPDIVIDYAYNDSLMKLAVTITQKQNFGKVPLFRIPLDIDIYVNGAKKRHRVMVDKTPATFSFDTPSRPDLVNVDAEKMLLGKKKDNKSNEELIFQFYHAPLFLDRYEAVKKLAGAAEENEKAGKVIFDALSDKFWNIRSIAADQSGKIKKQFGDALKTRLSEMALKDEKSNVREAVVKALNKNFTDENLMALYKEAVNDKAYSVVGAALEIITRKNTPEGLAIAKSLEQESSKSIINTLGAIYASYGSNENNAYFEKHISTLTGVERYMLVQSYGRFLLRCNDEVITNGLKIIEDVGRNDATWWVRLSAVQVLAELRKHYEDKERDIASKTEELRKKSADLSQITTMEAERTRAKSQMEMIARLLTDVKKAEKDKNLVKIYGVNMEEGKKSN